MSASKVPDRATHGWQRRKPYSDTVCNLLVTRTRHGSQLASVRYMNTVSNKTLILRIGVESGHKIFLARGETGCR